MASRKDETITVDPSWVSRVVLHLMVSLIDGEVENSLDLSNLKRKTLSLNVFLSDL